MAVFVGFGIGHPSNALQGCQHVGTLSGRRFVWPQLFELKTALQAPEVKKRLPNIVREFLCVMTFFGMPTCWHPIWEKVCQAAALRVEDCVASARSEKTVAEHRARVFVRYDVFRDANMLASPLEEGLSGAALRVGDSFART